MKFNLFIWKKSRYATRSIITMAPRKSIDISIQQHRHTHMNNRKINDTIYLDRHGRDTNLYVSIWDNLGGFFISKLDLNREFLLRCTLTLYMNANSVKHAQITAYTKKKLFVLSNQLVNCFELCLYPIFIMWQWMWLIDAVKCGNYIKKQLCFKEYVKQWNLLAIVFFLHLTCSPC